MSIRACLIAGLIGGPIGCGDRAPAPDAATPGGPLGFRFEPIALGDGAPLAITELAFVPGSADFVVLNKTHTVTHYRMDAGGVSATKLGSFEVPGVDETADCGLLSVAFDPDFAANRLVYFASYESPTHSRITRHEFDPADYGSVASTATLVIRVGRDDAQEAWHNVGSMGFDPDGNLWALFGDKVAPGTSQDLTTALGKVIRIVPDRIGAGYAPTPTNPFIGISDRDPDVTAIGLRSPWRGTLDDQGRLWIGDVGDSKFEEVNVSRFGGENFGNSLAEGPCTAGCDGLSDPITWWGRTNDHRYAQEDPQAVPTTRRVVWVGGAYPRSITTDRYGGRMFDRVLVGDFAGGWIRLVGLDAADRVAVDEPAGHLEAASSWAVGPDGYLYASTYGSALAWPYKAGSVVRAVATDE